MEHSIAFSRFATALAPLLIGLLLVMGGCGSPSFLITPVANTSALEEQTLRPGRWSAGKVVIIPVEGVLVDARSGGFLQPTENPLSLLIQQLDKAEHDSAVRAVVLRINSPGGSVTASDTIYQHVMRFKQRTGKPVIASTQDVTASGAYYVACAADTIMVHPTSVIGSIGVIFQTFDATGAMAKIGLQSDAIKSGELKDMGSPLRARSQGERAVMQGMVDEYHARFVSVVSSHRPIRDPATLQLITDGRVLSGQRAVELGLADRIGLLEDALDLAREKAGVRAARVVMYKRPYGYTGSIYAQQPTPPAQDRVLQISLPPSRAWLGAGFYYLWMP